MAALNLEEGVVAVVEGLLQVEVGEVVAVHCLGSEAVVAVGVAEEHLMVLEVHEVDYAESEWEGAAVFAMVSTRLAVAVAKTLLVV